MRRRGYLDITTDLMMEFHLGSVIPRSWCLVGSRQTVDGVVRLVFETLDDDEEDHYGPAVPLQLVVDDSEAGIRKLTMKRAGE